MSEDLIKAFKDLIPEEIIDDCSVSDTAQMVDLDMAFKLLLVEYPVPLDEFSLLCNIPLVVEAKKRPDGKYELRSTTEQGPDFRVLSASIAKEMRARFLLLKGFYATNFDKLTLPKQKEVVSEYEVVVFDGM